MAYDYISCLTVSLMLVTGLHVCSTEDSTSPPELPDPLKDGTYLMDCEEEISAERTDTANFWPGAIVPYVPSDNFEFHDKQSLYAALDDYHKYTCIRFIPRTTEESYLNIEIWSNLTGMCGSAAVCYQGGPQRARIRKNCSGKTIFIHELGHSLCLQHEHRRFDRDQYLDLSTCEDPSKISSKVDSIVTTGHVYDYFSYMHYGCIPCVGKPKLGRVTKCANSDELGVIDADKLNFFYNCQGCFRHRWYRVDSLTSEQETHLVNFASQEGDSGPLYMCRGYLDNGAIPPGIYIPAEKACVVSDEGITYKTTLDVQLFGIPGGPISVQNGTGTSGIKGYMLFEMHEAFAYTTHKLTRSGRNAKREGLVPAVTWLTREDGKTYTTIGYAITNEFAVFPTESGQPELRIVPGTGGPYFGILCCVEEKTDSQ